MREREVQPEGSHHTGLRRIARAVLPARIRRWIRGRLHALSGRPPVGRVRFGGLRRLTPISRVFGTDRGQPIDRYYIERFLAAHAADVRGAVLEIGDDRYTRRFGQGRVRRSDVLHVVEGNPKATLVGDLTRAESVPSGAFDCAVVTQTLPFIYDVAAAVRNLHRALRPGGVLLATFPGISQISRSDMDRWGDYWRFTGLSAKRLFEEVFQPEDVSVETHGNVLAAVAFLHGLAAEELRPEELDHRDPDYEVLIAVRAEKPEAAR